MERHLIGGLAQRAEATLETVLGVGGASLPLAVQAQLTSSLSRLVLLYTLPCDISSFNKISVIMVTRCTGRSYGANYSRCLTGSMINKLEYPPLN